MSRALRAALAAVPGAAVLWAAGADWWSTGIQGAVFGREGAAPAVVRLEDGTYATGGAFISYSTAAELVALAVVGVLLGAALAAAAARPARPLRLVAAVVAAAVVAHAVAPLDADWPPVAVAAVLVATCALVARRARGARR